MERTNDERQQQEHIPHNQSAGNDFIQGKDTEIDEKKLRIIQEGRFPDELEQPNLAPYVGEANQIPSNMEFSNNGNIKQVIEDDDQTSIFSDEKKPPNDGKTSNPKHTLKNAMMKEERESNRNVINLADTLKKFNWEMMGNRIDRESSSEDGDPQ